jgi:hypothetical protein
MRYTHTNKRLYLNPAMRRDYSSPGRTGSTSNSSCVVSTHRPAAQALHQPRRTSRCLSSSRGSSSTTSPMPRVRMPRHVARLVAGPSSTTSPTSRVSVPRHVVRFVTRLVAPLVVDYSASCRLVVDYFASAARSGASARRAAHHAAHHAARRRLLRHAQARH